MRVARVIPGHWEGDLIKGSGNRSAVGTLVERTTLFVTLAKMADASAASAVKGFGKVLKRIDAQRRLSMTYDQGREMAQHEQLTAQTGVTFHYRWQESTLEVAYDLRVRRVAFSTSLHRHARR